jgi:microtubule-associated protein-like 6
VGEILYPQCRKGVFAPTTWDPKLAERSATLPDVELSLEFVYGYNG